MKRLSLPLAAALALTSVALSHSATADTSMPPCPQSAAVITPSGRTPKVDCSLQSGDFDFAVTYWSVPELPEPRAVKVTVTDSTGQVVQTINELLEPSSPGGVGLEDVDGDGREELIIPMGQNIFNGSLNTRFSVWRAPGDRRHFERTQMVGQAVYPSDGYAVSNGGAFTARDLTFYLPTGAGYTLVVVITIEAEQVDPDTHQVLAVNCRAHQEDGLHAIDMDVYQAEDFFCASPAAMAIWPGAQRLSLRHRPPGH